MFDYSRTLGRRTQVSFSHSDRCFLQADLKLIAEFVVRVEKANERTS